MSVVTMHPAGDITGQHLTGITDFRGSGAVVKAKKPVVTQALLLEAVGPQGRAFGVRRVTSHRDSVGKDQFL